MKLNQECCIEMMRFASNYPTVTSLLYATRNYSQEDAVYCLNCLIESGLIIDDNGLIRLTDAGSTYNTAIASLTNSSNVCQGAVENALAKERIAHEVKTKGTKYDCKHFIAQPQFKIALCNQFDIVSEHNEGADCVFGVDIPFGLCKECGHYEPKKNSY